MTAQGRNLFFCFIAIVIFLFSPKVILAQNLLKNSGFEDGTDNWSYSPSTAIFSATLSFKHSGDYGGKITKEEKTSWAYFNQKLAIEADKYYRLSGWVLLNDSGIKNIKLRFYWLDSSEGKISASPIEIELKEKNSSFQFIQTEANLSPSNSQFADIQGYVYLEQENPANPAIFDDLFFEEIVPTPTPTPTDEPEPTNTPAPTATNMPTSVPSNTPTPSVKPSLTPTGGSTPTPTKEVTPTPPAGGLPTEEPGLILGETATQEAKKQSAVFWPQLLIGAGALLMAGASYPFWLPKIKKLRYNKPDETA